ncbi:hypothetical protein LTR56_010968 [Elasticomyces elasticus]|nr:hypothetical protein LTR56_010968 [Elasticomyces elasticus]KAK3662666.1 hypothetical protein LTR22_006516 [Elasticomyces elasticus]
MRSRAFPYLLILPVFSSALFTRSQCYDGIFTLVSRGSEEPQGQSVLETIAGGIAAALPGSGSNEVVYPALLSFWDSAPIGVTNAQQQLQDYYEQCPNGKIVLLGYSQGSYVLTTTLAGGNYSGQSWSPLASNIAENIAAIVLFGDQSRMLGQGTLATGTNCATTCTATAPLALKSPYSTSMQVYFDRLEEWCDADDPICCSTGNDIQAHLSYWSTNTTDTVVQFVQGKVGNLSTTLSPESSTMSASASSTSSTESSSPAATTSTTTSSEAVSTSLIAVPTTSTNTTSSDVPQASQSTTVALPSSAPGSSASTQPPAAPTTIPAIALTTPASSGTRTTTLFITMATFLCAATLLFSL